MTFCDSDPCQNGGTCIEGFGPVTSCNCTSGFTGSICDNDNPNMTFCEPDLCKNGGTCVEEFGPETSCNWLKNLVQTQAVTVL